MKSITFILLLIVSITYSQEPTEKEINWLKKQISINEEKTKSELISSVFSQLNLKQEKCKKEFISVKAMPNSKELSIVVIPEINIDDKEMESFELNSYILIVNRKTGEIKSEFYENSKTNEWTSDALKLTKITIDTAPYIIGKDKRAFGIRVHYLGSSKPNPYESETISLFIKNGNKLRRVLNKYEINGNFGEWDTNCTGNFTDFNSILIISNTLTNGYYDINIKTKIVKTNNFEDENGKCKSTNTKTIINSKLIFKDNQYNKSGL